jgi:hypothetical protein
MRRKGQTDLAADPFAKPGGFLQVQITHYSRVPRHPHSLYAVLDEFRKYNNVTLHQVPVRGTMPRSFRRDL